MCHNGGMEEAERLTPAEQFKKTREQALREIRTHGPSEYAEEPAKHLDTAIAALENAIDQQASVIESRKLLHKMGVTRQTMDELTRLWYLIRQRGRGTSH